MQGQQGQPPHHDAEVDVASLAGGVVSRPPGGEKGLPERTPNSSSGDVWHVRRVPDLAGSGATRTRPTPPLHFEAGERAGAQADGAPQGRSVGWERQSPEATPLPQQRVGMLALSRIEP
jgi:hypothetical protein